MNTLDQIIDDSREPLEVKRALAVKMLHNGIAPAQIARLLNVSVQFVSKWKICFEQSGATALRFAYTGGSSFLRDEQRSALLEWIAECGTLSLAGLTEPLQTRYGIE